MGSRHLLPYGVIVPSGIWLWVVVVHGFGVGNEGDRTAEYADTQGGAITARLAKV